MFKHLLVPLDGSRLAEAVLEPARTLAARLGAAVTLLHVLEQNAPAQIHGERHLRDVPEAEQYLQMIAAQMTSAGITTDYHVHDIAQADVTQSIAAHAAELSADLVVLATHGYGGVRDIMFGTIAQQVIGSGATPVLIIHPEQASPGFTCQKLLVPLDGSPDHDSSLPVATELAQMMGATVDLVTVVPRREDLAGAGGAVGRMLPRAMVALLEHQAAEETVRLAGLANDLKARGIPATARVERGDPCAQILHTARALDTDLLVLATHTRRGWAAFWSGSVAPRVLAQWRRPTLLIRAGQ